MATTVQYKEHRQFSKDFEVVECVYDFAKDGGATGALDLLKVKEACVLVQAYVKVNTACTSGGSATVIVGRTGDTDAVMTTSTGAVASLTAGAVIAGDAASVHKKLAADDILLMTIGTAALTAGKLTAVFVLQKF
jgi:hypothetical protein